MSLNVLVMTEDFRKDQDVLRPILKAMFAHLKKKSASIQFCQDDFCMQGVEAAMNWENIRNTIKNYKNFDVFLLLIDRDGFLKRETGLRTLRTKAEKMGIKTFIPECAHQEIEVWALAGCVNLPFECAWSEIRNDPHPKERFFMPYALAHQYSHVNNYGRYEIASQVAKKYKQIRRYCPELQTLEQNIQAVLT